MNPNQQQTTTTTLFIGCLPPQTNEGNLTNFLARFGSITGIELPRDKKLGFCLGFAKLQIELISPISEILSAELVFRGFNIIIRDCLDLSFDSLVTQMFEKRVFVSNLPKKWTDREIKEAFLSFGRVRAALRVLSQNKIPHPFGYVHFYELSAAKKCKEAKFLRFKNKKIICQNYSSKRALKLLSLHERNQMKKDLVKEHSPAPQSEQQPKFEQEWLKNPTPSQPNTFNQQTTEHHQNQPKIFGGQNIHSTQEPIFSHLRRNNDFHLQKRANHHDQYQHQQPKMLVRAQTNPLMEDLLRPPQNPKKLVYNFNNQFTEKNAKNLGLKKIYQKEEENHYSREYYITEHGTVTRGHHQTSRNNNDQYSQFFSGLKQKNPKEGATFVKRSKKLEKMLEFHNCKPNLKEYSRLSKKREKWSNRDHLKEGNYRLN